MRDAKRIPQVLEAIRIIWEKNPDMRLGQLIGNVAEGAALYYAEDEILLAAMDALYMGNEDIFAKNQKDVDKADEIK